MQLLPKNTLNSKIVPECEIVRVLSICRYTLPLTITHHQSVLEQTVLSEKHLFIISVYKITDW